MSLGYTMMYVCGIQADRSALFSQTRVITHKVGVAKDQANQPAANKYSSWHLTAWTNPNTLPGI